ncbi:chemotaxis protein CheA [Aquimonas voraii]|uniref:Chemotaxis protein CheA n=1 Tax=Aquimonas voraii TaxID=265719 RepID=A0A1G6W6E5_9GAMM|nr:chemotaxis protein CheA [Aquimonas voraii]SDD61404.1 two-component system, chemotaxis family, sensor kinase CheA [Aquimonas voraii]
MPIDMKQFQAVFFAESREGLDAMESGLLSLESSGNDPDTINTIFRAAHSIKGGAATFGFSAITGTTHLLETLLDQVRAGKREITAELSDALLASVDVLRELLVAAETGNPDDTAPCADLNLRLSALLDSGAPSAAPAKPGAATQAGAGQAASGWCVRFAPHPNLFITGNDPLRILRELDRLGELQAQCDTSQLPALEALEPATSYLRWTLSLPATVKQAAIGDAFAWVEDECDLSIEAITAAAPAATAAAPAPAAASTEALPVPAKSADIVPMPQASERKDVAKPAAGAAGKAERGAAEVDSSIRVNISKVDALINLVGELVITQAMLRQQSHGLDPTQHEKLLNGLALLDRNTRDLQEAVMSVRMLPVEFVFSRFPRMVRDLAARLNKKVNLRTFGEGTELDKGVIERIVDPLVHLVRNSVDHGLETPEEREAAGKDPVGTVELGASHQGGHIVIEITDDGRGLNRERILRKAMERGLPAHEGMADSEVWQLIFHPGLSTAEQVTDVSGRGVGMDVVRSNIAELGGEIDIESHLGEGTRVTIRLPLTLAILDGMTVAVGGETFVLPLGYVIEAMQPDLQEIRSVHGSGKVLKVRGDYLPLVNLSEFYRLGDARLDENSLVVVVEGGGRKLALVVDELLGQQQVVVKNLEANYRRIPAVSGATILGDGRVALIVDIGGLVRALATSAAA